MNPFNYWKRGRKVVPILKKAPAGSPYPLVWHQIQAGCFELSPYWSLIDNEYKLLEREIETFRNNNPRSSEESVQAFIIKRRPIYNRRIRKLQEAHDEYERTRLGLLKQQLISTFKVDVWDQALDQCDGDGAKELYNTYRSLVYPYTT